MDHQSTGRMNLGVDEKSGEVREEAGEGEHQVNKRLFGDDVPSQHRSPWSIDRLSVNCGCRFTRAFGALRALGVREATAEALDGSRHWPRPCRNYRIWDSGWLLLAWVDVQPAQIVRP